MKWMNRVILLFATLIAASCISSHYSVATDVDVLSWESPAVIRIDNTDTATLRDISLFLRTNRRFCADSLSLNLVILTPDSLLFEESMTLRVAPKQVPAALTAENEIPYRRRICFAHPGEYRIVVTPRTPVQGIEAVGVHIVKSI